MAEPFSIVIPTYRRGSFLARVLPSYLATGAAEVLVVDDASGPPHHRDLARAGETDPRVQLVTLPRHVGLPAARNEGARLARSEWVVYGEDDVWFTPEYPRTLIEHALRAGALAAAGTIALVPPAALSRPASEVNRAVRSRDPSADRRPDRFLGVPWPVEWLPSGDVVTPLLVAVAAVHRSVFDRVRFDPEYGGNAFREETDFFLSCAGAGIRTLHCPHVACGHMKATTRAAPGGAWSMGPARYALQMLANNRRFVRKHAEALMAARRSAGRAGGPVRIQAEFALTMLRRIRPARA